MRKQIFLLVVLGSIVGSTTGCTSKKVDQENSEISELTGDSSGGESGDAAAVDAEDDFGSDETVTDETSSASADKPSDAEATPGAEDMAADDSKKPSDELEGLDAAPAEPSTEQNTQDLATNTTEDPLLDPSAEKTDEGATDSSASMGIDETQGLNDVPAPAPIIPLQKMITTPYTKDGILVNALYIARPGDTTKSVSQKLFGSDRSKELKKINPTLARRPMKVGDKVYYNSPQRPSDSTSLLTYYEDMGLAPEVYLSQPGDNIRTVAKNLLGNENSWKELWSTNLEVESKAELSEGTRLRYWSSTETTPPAIAATTEKSAAPPAPPVTEAPPPPMPDEVAMATPPPPPSMESESPIAEPPPPPPMAEQPPPPPPPAFAKTDAPGAALGEDPDLMMTLGVGAILIMAAIALVIMRKKRARRNNMDFQTATTTHIE